MNAFQLNQRLILMRSLYQTSSTHNLRNLHYTEIKFAMGLSTFKFPNAFQRVWCTKVGHGAWVALIILLHENKAISNLSLTLIREKFLKTIGGRVHHEKSTTKVNSLLFARFSVKELDGGNGVFTKDRPWKLNELRRLVFDKEFPLCDIIRSIFIFAKLSQWLLTNWSLE